MSKTPQLEYFHDLIIQLGDLPYPKGSDLYIVVDTANKDEPRLSYRRCVPIACCSHMRVCSRSPTSPVLIHEDTIYTPISKRTIVTHQGMVDLYKKQLQDKLDLMREDLSLGVLDSSFHEYLTDVSERCGELRNNRGLSSALFVCRMADHIAKEPPSELRSDICDSALALAKLLMGVK